MTARPFAVDPDRPAADPARSAVDSERFAADSLFFEAVERDDPAERAALLDARCEGDPALRAEVEGLLAAHAEGDGILDRTIEGGLPRERTAASPSGGAGDGGGGDGGGGSTVPHALGGYEILGEIGRGGMGVVWKARDPRLDRVVAIKALAPQLAADPTARRRFAREARAAAAVTHPHVVTIHSVEPDGPTPFLVMEYVAGRSLRDKLDAEGALEVRETLRIGAQIAAGLAAAHERGLIHRDVKPGNVLLETGPSGAPSGAGGERVKLTDFGLARAADDVGITRTGQIAGTPQFMSPEQAEGLPVDSRSDLFSLGAVLYAMGAGWPPFRGDSTVAVLRKVCDDAAPPLREANPNVPAWLAECVDRLLEKDPDDRFQTAAEVVALLERWRALFADDDRDADNVVARGDTIDQLADVYELSRRRAEPPPAPAWRSPARWAATGRRVGAWRPSGRRAIAAAVLAAALLGVGLTEATGLTDFAGPAGRLVEADEAPAALVDGPNLAAADVPTATAPAPAPEAGGAGEVAPRVVDSAVPAAPANPQFVPPWGGPAGEDAAQFAPTLVRRFEGHTAPAKSVAVSPDGARVASGSGWPEGDRTARVWDVETGRPLYVFRHPAPVMDVTFSPDGTRLLTGAADGVARVFDLTSGEELRQFRGPDVLMDVNYSPDGALIVAAARFSGAVMVWDAETGDVAHLLRHEGRHPLRASVAPDGERVVAADESGQLLIWSLDGGTFLNALPTTAPDRRGSIGLALSPDGRQAIVGDNAGLVRLWDLDSGEEVWSVMSGITAVHAVAFAPDGATILAAGGAGPSVNRALAVLDRETGEKRLDRGYEGGFLWDAAFLPDGERFVAASGSRWMKGAALLTGDNAISLWRLGEAAPEDQE